jgi:hypothetical protein
MKIKMLQRTLGSGNASGNGTKWYEQDEIINCEEQWQKDLGKTFVDSGLAMEVKTVEPTEKKVVKKKTASKEDKPKLVRKKTKKAIKK